MSCLSAIWMACHANSLWITILWRIPVLYIEEEIESFRTCRPHGEIGLLVLSIYREILIMLLLYLKYSNYWENKLRGSNRCRFLFHKEYDCPLRSQKWFANIGYNLDDMRNLVEKSNNYFFLPVLGLNERAERTQNQLLNSFLYMRKHGNYCENHN